MASLNRGADVTSGLRKVTADMKTKNRADRTGAARAQALSANHKCHVARHTTQQGFVDACLDTGDRDCRAVCVQRRELAH